MDEVDLLKALGEIWSDATAIIESMYALRKKIRTLHADAEGDDDLAEVYKLVHAQIEAVMEALRVTQARVEGSVRASIAGSPASGSVSSGSVFMTPSGPGEEEAGGATPGSSA